MISNKTTPLIALILIALMPMPAIEASPRTDTCTYQTYKWNVEQKAVVEFHQVEKPYQHLSAKEIHDHSGCSVCMEDQTAIDLPGVETFYVCKFIADDVRATLLRLIKQGEAIYIVTGYRVGMTKGPVDIHGNRTQFSLHSYGIALDINAEQNGLYDRCPAFSGQCRLRRGGEWNPGQPGSLSADGAVVRQLKQLGFKWGGEILGKQKDFMHFSPSGY